MFRPQEVIHQAIFRPQQRTNQTISQPQVTPNQPVNQTIVVARQVPQNTALNVTTTVNPPHHSQQPIVQAQSIQQSVVIKRPSSIVQYQHVRRMPVRRSAPVQSDIPAQNIP